MTPEQTKLVAESFQTIKPRLPELGAKLYARLFEIAPETRALFKGDMKAQEAKLMEIFSEFVRVHTRSKHFLPVTGDRGQAVIPGIGAMHRRHIGYGVQAEHYAKMREAMMGALAEVLDGDFPPTVLEAWSEMFDMLAKSMREAAPGQESNPAAALGSRFGTALPESGDLDAFLGGTGERDTAETSATSPNFKEPDSI